MQSSAGEAEPTYRLRMNTEATGLLKENGRVTGVRYRTPDGTTGELHADLAVACDGRTSVLCTDAGLRPHEYPVPIDTWWFRLPKKPTERGNGIVGIRPRPEHAPEFARRAPVSTS